jgi:hypothetical protein
MAPALRHGVDDLLDLFRPSGEQILFIDGRAGGVKIDPAWNDSA